MVDITKEKRLNSQCKEEPKPVIEENRTATGFKSVRVNYWEINQVTSECQMDVLDKTCRQKTKKVNTTIEFFILELVQEPNFCLNCQFSVFSKKKKCFCFRPVFPPYPNASVICAPLASLVHKLAEIAFTVRNYASPVNE